MAGTVTPERIVTAIPKPKKRKKTARRNYSAQADVLFSKLVRAKGYCELAGTDTVRCNGPLQCMHIFSRRYRNTRWDFLNAFCGCAAHHTYYTHRPIEWDDYLRLHRSHTYSMLRAKALSTAKVDPKEVLVSLRALEGAS